MVVVNIIDSYLSSENVQNLGPCGLYPDRYHAIPHPTIPYRTMPHPTPQSPRPPTHEEIRIEKNLKQRGTCNSAMTPVQTTRNP